MPRKSKRMLNDHDDIKQNAAYIDAMIEKFRRKTGSGRVENIGMVIETDGKTYRLIRLNDNQFFQLYENSLSIAEDYIHLMYLYRDGKIIFSSFSRLYFALESLFGPSGKFFDDYKGSFSFPLFICFENPETAYILNVYNVRTSMSFKIAKLIHSSDNRFDRNIIHQPFPDFPRQEINHLIDYMAGFLSGYFESRSKYENQTFFGTVQSNLIVFGCRDNQYFDDEYESQDEYDSAVRELQDSGISRIN